MLLLLLLVLLGGDLPGPAGSTIRRRVVLSEKIADTTTLMVRSGLSVLPTLKRRLDFRIRAKIPKDKFNQKGIDSVGFGVTTTSAATSSSYGVDNDFCNVFPVGQVDGILDAESVTSLVVSSSESVVEAPRLKYGFARLWDVDNVAWRSRQPVPPTSDMTRALVRWDYELHGDVNKDFLMDGIENGFMIVDKLCDLTDIDRRNYKSIFTLNYDLAEKQILKEISLGRYIVTDIKPRVVSSLGAVPKGQDKV